MVEVVLGTLGLGGLFVWFLRCSGAVDGARSFWLTLFRRTTELPKERRAKVVVKEIGEADGRIKRLMSLGADIVFRYDSCDRSTQDLERQKETYCEILGRSTIKYGVVTEE